MMNDPHQRDTKSVLILWNPGEFANSLSRVLRGQRLVDSAEALEMIDFEEESFCGAIVLAELCWSDSGYSDLYGIDFTRSVLRARKKVKFPILFASFLPLEKILLDELGNKRLEMQIAGSVGHSFQRLPYDFDTLIDDVKAQPFLTELQSTDIFNNLCDVRGLIRGRVHELEGKLRSLDVNSTNADITAARLFENALDEIGVLIGDLNGLVDAIAAMKLGFQKLLTGRAGTLKGIHEYVEQCGLQLSSLIEDDAVFASNYVASREQPWKVLILDDEPESLTELRNSLSENGVESICATTVSSARRLIADDVYNEIVVAISDYRLLEMADGVEKHQPQQGYDFLVWLAAESHLTHLIALSGLSRKFLLESFQKYRTRIDVHSKQDLTGEHALNLFVDNVLDRGREVYDAVCSRPTVGDWKGLKPFYAAHRASSEYLSVEEEVSTRAIRYIRLYEELLETRDAASLLRSGMEGISELSTKLSGKGPSDLRSMRAFQSKLLGRRVALYLHLKLGFSRSNIFAALKGYLNPGAILGEIERELTDAQTNYDEKVVEEVKAKVHRKYKDNSTNLVTTNLALSFPLAANELLVEEKHWLATQVGITNFETAFGVSRQIPYFVQIALDEFLNINPEIRKRVEKEVDSFTLSGKLVVVGIRDAEDTMKAIRRSLLTFSETKQFSHLVKVLEQNIRTRVEDSPLRQHFFTLLANLSDAS